MTARIGVPTGDVACVVGDVEFTGVVALLGAVAEVVALVFTDVALSLLDPHPVMDTANTPDAASAKVL